MLNKGDKIVLKSNFGTFGVMGDEFEVTVVNDDIVCVESLDSTKMWTLPLSDVSKYFHKVVYSVFKEFDVVKLVDEIRGVSYFTVGDVFTVKSIGNVESKLVSNATNKTYRVKNTVLNKYFEKQNIEKSCIDNQECNNCCCNQHINMEYVAEILENSEVEVKTFFDRCTVVVCKLPSGYVITESVSCINPNNYNKDLDFHVCMELIEEKIYQLEEYKMFTD